jgi:hypothetical protein
MYLFIYALQPFVEPRSLFSFLIFYTVSRAPWEGDKPVARSLPAHTGQHKQNKRTQTFMPQVGFEPTIPVFERVKTVHVLDRAAIMISIIKKYLHIFLGSYSRPAAS